MKENLTINEKEKEILEFWEKNKTFEKSLKQTEKGKPYVFYDGPPFATGLPHHGHLLASILKDVFPRFFTMKGRYVKRTWGWDCHGLPIENIAEKELGLNSKDEIEKMGVKKFNDFCRGKVLTFSDEWKSYINRIGRWVDFEGGYKTMDCNYMESVWWAFKQLYDKGYLYEGEKILMYCPRCATPLAKSEIAMDNSYKMIKDLSVTVKLKLKDYADTYFLAWTTTPWTLPSNLALAVNPKLIYVFVKDKNDGNTYVLAKDLLSKFYKSEEDYEIVKEVTGKELENKTYEPLFPYFKDNKNSFKILIGDFVTAEEGTGIVHIAPAFGEDDNAIARKYGIEMVQPVDENGNFTEEVTDYAGEYVHEINEKIVIDLKTSKKAIMSRKIEHEYPFCYRCETKLMYRALPAWFVDIQKIKAKLLKFNLKINWIPEFLKEGRMQHNISTAPDWNITRNRYWATAIPIWKSESGKIKVIGSIEELKKFAVNLPKVEEVNLHKDFLDEIILEVDGEKYKRIPEVVDCWFESGSMPFAQFHYPFENKDFFEKNYPADFVVEYIGQTRAWFYYMIALSGILFDKIPFQNVLTTGTIMAEDGDKMSKSKGNFTDPAILIEKYGADAFRFYLLQSTVMDANNSSFLDKNLEEVYKKVILITNNVLNFYELYGGNSEAKEKSENLLDKWIISEVNDLIKVVEDGLESYQTIKVCNRIRIFIDDLSTWYVRRSRERFNSNDPFAKSTLKYVLENFGKVIAPIMPFMAERIQQILGNSKSSIHLESWPKANIKLINEKNSIEMELTRKIVSLTLRTRDKNGIGVKWPLPSLLIKSSLELKKELLEIIKEETNVKEIVLEISKNLSEPEIILEMKITSELEAEGYSREITRKIQALRKEAGLVKEDKIKIKISKEFGELISSYIDFVKEKVGAESIDFETVEKDFEYLKEGKIKDKVFRISLSKI